MASLSLELRLLTMIMFSNLYPLSSTSYTNLSRALFLHDLITDAEIDVCSHIFHIVAKTVDWFASRNCIPFCCLSSRILKLKGVLPSKDERLYPRPSPININTLSLHDALPIYVTCAGQRVEVAKHDHCEQP